MSIILIILGLALFVGLVLIHEWGHYKAARKSGVDVEEFGLGFPPKLAGVKLASGMMLTINALPLGGFVRLKGEHDSDTEPGSYGAAPLRSKVKIMLAGVFMNLLIALLLLGVLAVVGLPKVLPNQFTVASDTKVTRNDVLIGAVEDNSPATNAKLYQDGVVGESAALETGDVIKTISCYECGELVPGENSFTLTSADQLPEITSRGFGKLLIDIERDGTPATLYVELRSKEEVEASKNTDTPVGYLGVSPSEFTIQKSTWSAPIVAVGLSAQITYETLKGISTAIGSLFVGDTTTASSQVSGPVGIFFLLSDGSQLGIEFILFIIAILSLTLAIMNTLPIPALDGGRLFVTLLYRALRRPLSQKTEERIHGTGFAVLMGLFLLITIVDVRRFF